MNNLSTKTSMQYLSIFAGLLILLAVQESKHNEVVERMEMQQMEILSRLELGRCEIVDNNCLYFGGMRFCNTGD